jgi:hypothetical protein
LTMGVCLPAECATLHRPKVEARVVLEGKERAAQMPTDPPGDWKDLAEQASTEMNSEKLIELVNELNQVLGEREDKPRQKRHQGNQL